MPMKQVKLWELLQLLKCPELRREFKPREVVTNENDKGGEAANAIISVFNIIK